MNTIKIIRSLDAKNISAAVEAGRLLLVGWECPADLLGETDRSELAAYISRRGQHLHYSEPTETYYASDRAAVNS